MEVNFMKRLGLLLSVFILSVCSLEAITTDGDYANSAMGFKEIGVSPRTTALGGSFVAIANDGFAAYYNPAGLSQLYSMNVDLSTGILNNDRMIFNGTYSHPFSYGVFSLGITYFQLGGLEERGESAPSVLLSEFNDNQMGIQLSYGRSLDQFVKGLSVGLRTEYYYQKLFSSTAQGFSLSYGVLYRFYSIRMLRDLSAGVAINNLPGQIKWDSGTKEDIQTEYKFGLGYRLFNEKLIIISEIASIKDRPIDFNIGMEFNYQGFMVRGGVNRNLYNGGVGFHYKVYEINYSLTADPLGVNHQISLGYQFGGQVDEEMRAKVMDEVINERANNAYTEGLFHMENYRYNDAIAAFNLALLWDPNMVKAEGQLKEAKLHTKDEIVMKGSIERKEKELAMKGTCPTADILLKHYYAGITYYIENDMAKAITEWKYVLSCDPKNEKAKANIEKAELKLKGLQEKVD